MTVVIAIDKSNAKEYASGVLKSPSTEDFRKADKLDQLVKHKIENYVKSVGLLYIKKGRVIYYWEVGNIIREIFFKSSLVLSEEKGLFFKNVRLHLDKNVFPDDDPSRNRNIPEQFFRLAGYSKEVVEKVKWTTWSYLFDSPLLSGIKNFDTWFSKNLLNPKLNFDQAFSRLWFQTINVLLKNVRTDDWSDKILLTSIESLFELCIKIVELGYKTGDKKLMVEIKNIIGEKRKEFILLKSESISKEEYLDIILNEFKKRYTNE